MFFVFFSPVVTKMASIDLSDPEIQAAVEDVLNTKTDTNWLVFTSPH